MHRRRDTCCGETSGHETQLVCGHFTFDPKARLILLDSLPDWLNNTLKIIGGKAGTETMGSGLIALKLSEIIYMQAIRAFMSNEGRVRKRLAGFTDPHISRILQNIHTSPEHPWTVTEPAQIAGLSRTTFSTRFDELLTHTPLAYMTAWRMQLARRLLIDSRLAIIEIAERSGYRSETTFGRVFKRYFDRPSASYRRNAITRPAV
ncbi:MAG: AraC family transcriptional regulator [Pseudomonadota bacterium]|nr:AraC family transcriptional regulator [Pseudomonadota bacterium]